MGTYPPASHGIKHAPAARAVQSVHSFQSHEPKFSDWLRSIWEGLTQDPWKVWESVVARWANSFDEVSNGLASSPGANAVKTRADAPKLLVKCIVMNADG